MRNANGYGSIIKLKGNRRKPFAIRLTVGYKENGSQIFSYLSYHKTKKEANAALVDFNENSYDIDLFKITFNEVYEKWKVKAFENITKGSQTNYIYGYKQCEPIYDKPFKDLKTLHIQRIIDEIEAPSTKRKVKVLLNQLYKYALENDIVNKDYSKFLKLETVKAKEKTIFTPEEIKILWNNLNEIEDLDIILILLYTGMRISELLEIETKNVFLEERYMIGGKKTEAGINRIIPISKHIEPLIKKRLDTNKKYLITSRKGLKLNYDNYTKRYFRPTLNKLKIVHSVHETRHTFISKMNQLNVNQLTIKKIVGHSTKDITDHYTHKNLDELIEAIDCLVYC